MQTKEIIELWISSYCKGYTLPKSRQTWLSQVMTHRGLRYHLEAPWTAFAVILKASVVPVIC